MSVADTNPGTTNITYKKERASYSGWVNIRHVSDVASEREAARCPDSHQEVTDLVENDLWTKPSGANDQGH